jgi:hypothetical protein
MIKYLHRNLTTRNSICRGRLHTALSNFRGRHKGEAEYRRACYDPELCVLVYFAMPSLNSPIATGHGTKNIGRDLGVKSVNFLTLYSSE